MGRTKKISLFKSLLNVNGTRSLASAVIKSAIRENDKSLVTGDGSDSSNIYSPTLVSV